MKKFLTITLSIIALSLPMALPFVVSAAGVPSSLVGIIPCTAHRDNTDPSPTPSGLNCNSWNDLVEVVQFFINYAFVIATILATASFTWAGWLYLTSQGNPGQVSKAHDIFFKVVKGFLFMGLAYLLVRTILVTIAKPDYSKLQ